MLDQVVTRLRSLFRMNAGASLGAPAEDADTEGELAQDPEWDELLDWARERPTPAPLLLAPAPAPIATGTAVSAAATAAARDDDDEWAWQVARAKAHALASAAPPAPPSSPVQRLPPPGSRTPSAPQERPRAAASLSVSSLAQRLEALATAARAQAPHPSRRATGRS